MINLLITKIAKQSFCDFLFFIIVTQIFIVIRKSKLSLKLRSNLAPTFEIIVKQICSFGFNPSLLMGNKRIIILIDNIYQPAVLA
jgi:hypothetical protein